MEQVNGLIAYHISIEGGFSIGDVIISGKKKNGVYKKYVKALFKLRKTPLDRRRCLIQHLLEKYRKKHYPEYPSRFTALYVQLDMEKSLDVLNMWKRNGFTSVQILTLELNGCIHRCAHQKLANEDFPSKEEIKKKIYSYWNGIDGNEEYLFSGQAKVINAQNMT